MDRRAPIGNIRRCQSFIYVAVAYLYSQEPIDLLDLIAVLETLLNLLCPISHLG